MAERAGAKRRRIILQVCLDSDADLLAWCHEEAKREGRSASEFVRRLLLVERACRRNADFHATRREH